MTIPALDGPSHDRDLLIFITDVTLLAHGEEGGAEISATLKYINILKA